MKIETVLPVLKSFDDQVRRLRTPLPAAEVGDRVCCHPCITTEADFQRWFGAALERELPELRVHAEVHAAGTESGHASRVDLTVHAQRDTPYLWNREVVETDVLLCMELKILPVGARDRGWARAETAHAALERLVAQLSGDLAKRPRGAFDVVSVVFLEPFAYTCGAEERHGIATQLRDHLTRAGFHVHLPQRDDGSPMCIALVTRTPASPENDR